MDAPGLDETLYRRCLNDLAAVNRLTSAHSSTLQWLERVIAQRHPPTTISVLDIGSGQGDLLRAIARFAEKKGLTADLMGIDLNPRSALVAQGAAPPDSKVKYITGDIFQFASPTGFDLIVTSQFTHHLSNADVIGLVKWMEAHASLGWHISDLHRHWLPYYGFRWLARLAGWHEIVRQDGTVSIARGFKRGEWLELLAQAGSAAEVRWHWLFRHSISRTK